MIVGKILQQACEGLGEELLHKGRTLFSEPQIRWENRQYLFPEGEPLSFLEMLERVFALSEEELLAWESAYNPIPGRGWNDATCQGDAYKDYSWGANVLEIEVDEDTLEITPARLTSVIDVGTPLHPLLAAGQVEGGALQSLGYGYMEDAGYREGKYTKHRMAAYSIPTTLDAPAMRVSFDGIPFEFGPGEPRVWGSFP